MVRCRADDLRGAVGHPRGWPASWERRHGVARRPGLRVPTDLEQGPRRRKPGDAARRRQRPGRNRRQAGRFLRAEQCGRYAAVELRHGRADRCRDDQCRRCCIWRRHRGSALRVRAGSDVPRRRVGALPPLLTDPDRTLGLVDTISFARGVPAPECIPVELLADCARAALEQDGRAVLSYGPGGGYGPLREHLAEQHGVTPGRVIVTNGSLQGFAFLAEQLVSPGTRVLVEAPTYDRPLKILARLGAEVTAVPMDEDGLDPDALEQALGDGSKPA